MDTQVSAVGFTGDGSGLTGIPVDNFGDHQATQNIETSNNWLSNDGNNEGVFVDTDGDVGINTNTPSNSLHVVGSVRIVDGKQADGRVFICDANGKGTWTNPDVLGDDDWVSSGDDMYSGASGNVGIGTSTPGAKLDVGGQIWQSGTGESVFIGVGAGENDDLSANRNAFIGYCAGQSNSSGDRNTALATIHFIQMCQVLIIQLWVMMLFILVRVIPIPQHWAIMHNPAQVIK